MTLGLALLVAVATAPAPAAAAPAPSVTTPATSPFPLPILDLDAAPDPHALTLDPLQTVRYALAHSPTVLAKRAALANAVSNFSKQRGLEYPTIDGQLESQLQKEANTSGGLAEYGISPQSVFSQNTAQITGMYNLYNGSAQGTAQLARRQVDSARGDLERTEEQVTGDVSASTYNLASSLEAIRVAESDRAYQQALLDAARTSEKYGRVAGVDVLRAQVAVTRSESTLISARTDAVNAQEALAVQIGAPSNTRFTIPEEIPDPPLPNKPIADLVAQAQRARPDVAMARADLQVAQLTDGVIDNDLRPTVQLTGAFGSQVSPTSLASEQQSIDLANAESIASYNFYKANFPTINFPSPTLEPNVLRPAPGFWSIGMTSTFTLPLIDYGTRANEHHAARAQIASAQAALDTALADVERDVRTTLRNAEADFLKLRLAEQSETLAVESARIAQLQYKNGLISFTDVTQTQQTALSAQNDLIAARAAYVIALIRFRTSLGPSDPASAADLRGL